MQVIQDFCPIAYRVCGKMKKASVTGLPGGPRPSSVRRISNLRALVEEFGERDIGCAAAALFLSCSLSSARNYVSELLDAGVLAAHPVRQGAGCLDRTLYQLTADRLVQQRFLATLAESDGAGFSFGPGDPPARRDPLVAALFGAPGLGAEHREPAGRARVANYSRFGSRDLPTGSGPGVALAPRQQLRRRSNSS